MLEKATEQIPSQEKKLLTVCQYCFDELDENKKRTGKKILPDEAARLFREENQGTSHVVCNECSKKTHNPDGTLNIDALRLLAEQSRKDSGLDHEEFNRKKAEFKADLEAKKAEAEGR